MKRNYNTTFLSESNIIHKDIIANFQEKEKQIDEKYKKIKYLTIFNIFFIFGKIEKQRAYI